MNRILDVIAKCEKATDEYRFSRVLCYFSEQDQNVILSIALKQNIGVNPSPCYTENMRIVDSLSNEERLLLTEVIENAFTSIQPERNATLTETRH